MTVSSEVTKSGPYVGNGVTTVFPYAFRILEDAHIQVVQTENGIDTVLVSGFSVSGKGEDAGGNITFDVAPTASKTITLVRNAPLTQSTDLENQGAYYAQSIEDALDLAAMRDQQLQEQIGRSVKIPVTANSGISTDLPLPEANMLIGWNEGCDKLQNIDTSTMATIVAFGTMNADTFTGDGATTIFALTANPGAQANLDVSVDGFTKIPGVDYIWSTGAVVTFPIAPVLGAKILARYSRALPQGSADAAAVTTDFGVSLGRLLTLNAGTVAQLLADTTLTYAGVTAGDVVSAAGFRYAVAASGASDYHVITAGGIKMYVCPDGGFNVKAFGVVGDGVADDTAKIQKAIDAAEALVQASVDGLGDKVGGTDVVFSGEFRISEPLRVATSNVCLVGLGGATIYPYFTSMTGYNGAKPAIILGTAEVWQNSGSISNAIKYNRITGINIKRVTGYNTFIGILVSGTRNAIVSNCLVERGFCGLYLENTSELYTSQVSVIGSTYGVLCDNRGGRIAANSVLNVANTDNDVSSNTFDMLTVYYSQHTGFLAINTGTTTVNGMTMGLFSDNPSVGSPGLGLPADYAGFHVWGGPNLKWTRGLLVSNAVFEAPQDKSRDCIRLDATTANNPILGCTFNGVHVQTYAADYDASTVTTFIHAVQSGSGNCVNIVVRDSGYTFQSSGFYYGRMAVVKGFAGVLFENCYPNSAFATSSIGYSGIIAGTETMERVNIDAFPPTGWTVYGTTGSCSKQGGSSGNISYLRFTGTTDFASVYKSFAYREYVPDLSSPFISFLARGDGTLLCGSKVNNAADTYSTTVNETNIGRYGNAIIRQNVDSTTEWKRFIFCFNPFAANYAFDTVDYVIGIDTSAGTTKKIEITDIKVGYFKGHVSPYNPF